MPARSVGRLSRTIGRRALWTVLVAVALIVAVNGVRTIASPPRTVASSVSAVDLFPDDEARAFATRFASRYLSYSPRRPDAFESSMRGLLTDRLISDAALQVPEDAPAQRVMQAWVARAEADGSSAPSRPGRRPGRSHGLVTVACVVVGGRTTTTRYLQVPVARDDAGGLIVDDLPALTSPPPMARVPEPDETMLSEDADAIEAILTRFFPAYLSGGSVAPEFLAPGSRVEPLGHDYKLQQLVSVAQDGPTDPVARRVLATVEARDTTTGAVYPLRYRLRVALVGDRWLVDTIEG